MFRHGHDAADGFEHGKGDCGEEKDLNAKQAETGRVEQ